MQTMLLGMTSKLPLFTRMEFLTLINYTSQGFPYLPEVGGQVPVEFGEKRHLDHQNGKI